MCEQTENIIKIFRTCGNTLADGMCVFCFLLLIPQEVAERSNTNPVLYMCIYIYMCVFFIFLNLNKRVDFTRYILKILGKLQP